MAAKGCGTFLASLALIGSALGVGYFAAKDLRHPKPYKPAVVATVTPTSNMPAGTVTKMYYEKSTTGGVLGYYVCVKPSHSDQVCGPVSKATYDRNKPGQKFKA